MNKKANTICRICNKKVIKFANDLNGFMDIENNLYHYMCVEKYGYQKFCKEVIEYKKKNLTPKEINKNLEGACKAMDAANK